MNKCYLYFIIVIFILGSCKNSTTNIVHKNNTNHTTSNTTIEPTQQGRLLFSKHCSACHLGVIDDATCVETIIGIAERHPNGINFLRNYIANSAQVKANGDPYANDLDKVYPSPYEHRFDTLMSEQEIYILSNFIAQI